MSLRATSRMPSADCSVCSRTPLLKMASIPSTSDNPSRPRTVIRSRCRLFLAELSRISGRVWSTIRSSVSNVVVSRSAVRRGSAFGGDQPCEVDSVGEIRRIELHIGIDGIQGDVGPGFVTVTADGKCASHVISIRIVDVPDHNLAPGTGTIWLPRKELRRLLSSSLAPVL